ncbi:MAG TPA: hypothetical protein DD670_04310 [Planctomycetaceae bacterium]|nr:hypothetical protein [Planctomycetaceae bacterium]
MSAMKPKSIRFDAAVAVALAVVCQFVSGCGPRLDDAYGQRRGLGVEKSVNGTRVLSDMFEKAGHTVFSWQRLSPRLWQRADCIVWFPDDFDPPSDEVRFWLEQWLEDEPGRTLIYVGRDFDAAPWYWEKIAPQIAESDRENHRRCLSDAKIFFEARRAVHSNEQSGEQSSEQSGAWFGVDSKPPKRTVRTLAGESDWIDGVDSGKLEIELHGRMLPGSEAQVVLQSDGDALITSQEVGDSRLIVVANGSFLLNLPLVNHEHRKLAARLIDAVGPPKKTVVFLESRDGGPPISEKDPSAAMPIGLAIFNTWPTNWILLHLVVVGIVFCCWRFPIFGRPIPPEPLGLSDFGKHLDAVGELLKQSRDAAYARERVKQYFETIKQNR